MLYEITPPGCFEHPLMESLCEEIDYKIQYGCDLLEYICDEMYSRALWLYQRFGAEGFEIKYSHAVEVDAVTGEKHAKVSLKNGAYLERNFYGDGDKLRRVALLIKERIEEVENAILSGVNFELTGNELEVDTVYRQHKTFDIRRLATLRNAHNIDICQPVTFQQVDYNASYPFSLWPEETVPLFALRETYRDLSVFMDLVLFDYRGVVAIRTPNSFPEVPFLNTFSVKFIKFEVLVALVREICEARLRGKSFSDNFLKCPDLIKDWILELTYRPSGIKFFTFEEVCRVVNFNGFATKGTAYLETRRSPPTETFYKGNGKPIATSPTYRLRHLLKRDKSESPDGITWEFSTSSAAAPKLLNSDTPRRIVAEETWALRVVVELLDKYLTHVKKGESYA